MTERQAWKEMADKFANGYIAGGVCEKIAGLQEISVETKQLMNKKVSDCLDGRAFFMWQFELDEFEWRETLRYNTEVRKLRADWCYLMYFEMGGE